MARTIAALRLLGVQPMGLLFQRICCFSPNNSQTIKIGSAISVLLGVLEKIKLSQHRPECFTPANHTKILNNRVHTMDVRHSFWGTFFFGNLHCCGIQHLLNADTSDRHSQSAIGDT